MPSSPPTHKAPGSGRQSRPAPHRKTTTERGYGTQWQKIRLVVLADEPLCRFCHEQGRITPAKEVDHIDGDSFNNERSNLRPLCKPCHQLHTARTQAFGKYQHRPEWLEPSIIPVTMLCGAPASGKNAYVAANASKRDLVIDLDAIAAQLSGTATHAWDRNKWLGPAIRHRNTILSSLSKPAASWPHAWFIISEPRADNRQWWADRLKPQSIIVIETQPSICMERAKADPDRQHDITLDAIGRWWEQYTRRDGDIIVKG